MKNKTEFTIKNNSNVDTFEIVSKAIKDNDDYCCCAIEKNADSKCMCKNFREQEESGFCHCGRFYKVQNFPMITILCAPDNDERALTLAEELTTHGFIVTTPMYRTAMNYMLMSDYFNELQKAKIEKADVVFVLNTNQEAVDFMAEQILWAEELQKKILYEYTEEVKNDED